MANKANLNGFERKFILQPGPYGLDLDVVMAMSDRAKKQKLRWGESVKIDIYTDGVTMDIKALDNSDGKRNA